MQRWIWGGGLVLLVALGLARWALSPGGPPIASVTSQVSTVRPKVPPAGAPSAASAGLDADTQRDRAWCRRGISAPDAAASTEELAVAEAETSLRSDWRTALLARGDARSRGLAMLAAGPTAMSPTDRVQLAMLANEAQDPALIAWALSSCEGGSDCAGVSPRMWAQRDPGNLAPWLAEFNRAAQAGETGSLGEALYQIGQAKRDDNYSGLAAQTLDQARRSDTPGLRSEVESQALTNGYFALGGHTDWHSIGAYCNAAVARADDETQRLCEAALDAVWRLDDTLVGALISTGFARRLPHADKALWQERRDRAYVYAQLARDHAVARLDGARSGNPCGDDQALRRYAHDVAQLGERGVLEETLHGRDVARMAQSYRAAAASLAAASAANP